jgi:hypothetical protein
MTKHQWDEMQVVNRHVLPEATSSRQKSVYLSDRRTDGGKPGGTTRHARVSGVDAGPVWTCDGNDADGAADGDARGDGLPPEGDDSAHESAMRAAARGQRRSAVVRRCMGVPSWRCSSRSGKLSTSKPPAPRTTTWVFRG